MGEYSSQEPTKLFREEPETHDQFSGANIKIIRQGHYLSIHKPSASLLGLLEACFLCQLDFFISKSRSKDELKVNRRRRWVYNTYDQWLEMLPDCSRSTLKRAIKRLEKFGIVLSRREPWRKYYSINYEAWAYFLENPEALNG